MGLTPVVPLRSLWWNTPNISKSKKFFELPEPTKRQIEYVPGPYPQRGWSRVGSESTAKLFGALNKSNGKVITDTDSKVSYQSLSQPIVRRPTDPSCRNTST